MPGNFIELIGGTAGVGFGTGMIAASTGAMALGPIGIPIALAGTITGALVTLGSMFKLGEYTIKTMFYPLKRSMELFDKHVIKPIHDIGAEGFKIMKQAFRWLFDAAKQLDKIVGASASFKNLEILFLPFQLAFEFLGAMMKKGTIDTVRTGLETLRNYIDFLLVSGEIIGELASIPFDIVYDGLHLVAEAIEWLADLLGVMEDFSGWIGETSAADVKAWFDALKELATNPAAAIEDLGEDVNEAVQNVINIDLRDTFIEGKDKLISMIQEQMGMFFG